MSYGLKKRAPSNRNVLYNLRDNYKCVVMWITDGAH